MAFRRERNGPAFENTEAYKRRKMTDKFTLEVLVHYAGSLALNHSIQTSTGAFRAGNSPGDFLACLSIDEPGRCQQRLGIEPTLKNLVPTKGPRP